MPIALRGGLVVALALAYMSPLTAQRATKDPQTLANEGAAALDERRFDAALAAFTAAATVLPNDPSVALGAGLAAFMLGRSDDAETWFVRALKLEPTLIEASILLGELQHRIGRLDEAIATYEAAQSCRRARRASSTIDSPRGARSSRSLADSRDRRARTSRCCSKDPPTRFSPGASSIISN